MIEQAKVSEDFIESVARLCLRKKHIYLACEKKSQMTKISQGLKKYKIVKKRGVYTNRGIVVFTVGEVNESFINYFDFIYEVSK